MSKHPEFTPFLSLSLSLRRQTFVPSFSIHLAELREGVCGGSFSSESDGRRTGQNRTDNRAKTPKVVPIRKVGSKELFSPTFCKT